MPTVPSFKKNFGLKKDVSVRSKGGLGFTVRRCVIGHEETIQYERFEFPTVLALALDPAAKAKLKGKPPGAIVEAAAEALGILVAGSRILPGRCCGRLLPYECHFGALDNGKVVSEKGEELVEFTTRGWADRRYDVDGFGEPLKPKVEKSIDEKRAMIEETRSVKAALPKGYRMIRSTYAFKCSTCGDTVEKGSHIAKLEKDTSSGGWSHALCLADDSCPLLKPIIAAKKVKSEELIANSSSGTNKRKRGDLLEPKVPKVKIEAIAKPARKKAKRDDL